MIKNVHHQLSGLNDKASEIDPGSEQELVVYPSCKHESTETANDSNSQPAGLKKLKIKPRSAPSPKLSGQSSAVSPLSPSADGQPPAGGRKNQPVTDSSLHAESSHDKSEKERPENLTNNPPDEKQKIHRVQHRKTAMPPSAQRFMQEQSENTNTDTGKSTRKQSRTEVKPGAINLLNGFFALLAAMAAAAAATLPLWSEISRFEQLISPLPLGVTAFSILLGICFLLRKKTCKVICGIFLLFMAAIVVSILMSETLPAVVQGWLLQSRAFNYLGCSVMLTISLILVAAAFVLNFNFSRTRLIFSLCLGCLAGLMPWLSPAFLEELNPLTLPPDFPIVMLKDWRISDRGSDFIIWNHTANTQNRLSFIFIANSHENDGGAVNTGNPPDPLRSHLELIAKDEKLGPISSLPFAYRPDYHRYVSFGAGNQALDALVVPCEYETGAFMVVFKIDDYPSHQSFIADFFKNI